MKLLLPNGNSPYLLVSLSPSAKAKKMIEKQVMIAATPNKASTAIFIELGRIIVTP
ncbi:MAG: hypothetical protein HRT47_12130 [Candidatus Caenarcaniphilales bacterium]|nr:hypothetical protein [Candidatus Caenarcaniphilales bacterium]